MSVLSRIADHLILFPSTDRIETENLTPETVTTPLGTVETWVCSSGEKTPDDWDALAIKFPGSGGRAERSSPHPLELWDGTSCCVWTVNHHGYGNSSGRASLQNFAQTCDAVWNQVAERYGSQKIVITGSSLGCISALYVAARYRVAGLFLRNPPPIAQLIRQRVKYNWWSFGTARFIADQVPRELDAVTNASQCSCPAVFIRSEKDRVVPTAFQQLILDQYAGDSESFVIRNASHHDGIPESQEQEYLDAVNWLRKRVLDM